MRLTPKLLSFLPRFFRKDPDRFLALRLRYRWGAMKWTVSDAVLTTTVTGGPGQNLAVDLTQYTLAELVNHLAAQPGYRVVYADNSERALLSARVLLDGSGDQDASNGDHLYGYTSLLWSYLESQAVELQEAKAQIDEALAQMSTRTASGDWLDEWGGYYGVPRRPGELDESYGPRIIATILRPRGNNVAIEMAISAYTGQETRVRDVTQWSEGFNLYDGSIAYDGQETHDSSAAPRYGLFDVEYGYNLLSGTDISEFADIVRGLVERLRDAGTHLRALALQGGTISDTFTPPTDGGIASLAGTLAIEDEFSEPSDEALRGELAMAALSDSAAAPDEGEVLAIGYATCYDGSRSYDESVPHASGHYIVEPAPDFFAPLKSHLEDLGGNLTPTFTRDSIATCVDDRGRVRVVEPDEPRFEEAGLLCEGASTNLIAQSQAFDLWTMSDSKKAVANQGAAPDGTESADRWTFEVTNTAGRIFRNVSLSGATAGRTFTYSVWIRALPGQTSPSVRLFIQEMGGSSATQNAQRTISPASEWQRYSFTYTVQQNDRANLRVEVRAGQGSVGSTVDVLLWGAQCEELPFASSYIPTAGSVVTRAADVLNYSDDSVVADAAGSVYCEYTLIGNPPAKATLLSLGDTPILTIDVDGTVEFTDGVNTASVAHVFAGQTTRIGARWGQEGIQLFVDENASNPVAYSGTLPRSEGVFTIGNILDGSMPAWGWIRNVAVWRRDLGPNVLQALTRGVVTP